MLLESCNKIKAIYKETSWKKKAQTPFQIHVLTYFFLILVENSISDPEATVGYSTPANSSVNKWLQKRVKAETLRMTSMG